VTHELAGDEIEFTAHNQFHAPMEVALVFDVVSGIEFPHPDDSLRWVVPPNSDLTLLGLAVLGGVAAPNVRYHYIYLPGDPESEHQPNGGYRVPFSAGSDFAVTQAYPEAATHRTLDSKFAVDVAMPVGTDIFAARGGIVFDVTSSNFRSGLDIQRDGQSANIVRVLHDDGTYAIYAHLNWNSIRVRPGDEVETGEYIADSGNTGFSSGPHLHFAVQRNTGMRIESLPVVFKGQNLGGIVPATGDVLTAYP
jgi:murein DD-endopeptidase MepM/ murein hydrolase activator NlpD